MSFKEELYQMYVETDEYLRDLIIKESLYTESGEPEKKEKSESIIKRISDAIDKIIKKIGDTIAAVQMKISNTINDVKMKAKINQIRLQYRNYPDKKVEIEVPDVWKVQKLIEAQNKFNRKYIERWSASIDNQKLNAAVADIQLKQFHDKNEEYNKEIAEARKEKTMATVENYMKWFEDNYKGSFATNELNEYRKIISKAKKKEMIVYKNMQDYADRTGFMVRARTFHEMVNNATVMVQQQSHLVGTVMVCSAITILWSALVLNNRRNHNNSVAARRLQNAGELIGAGFTLTGAIPAAAAEISDSKNKNNIFAKPEEKKKK